MSNTGQKTNQRIGPFFKNFSWKNCLIFLVFLLLSFIFWIGQVYRERFEVDYTIPIKYVNIPDSIIFEDQLPENIHTIIKDDGSALFRYFFSKKKDSLEIDIRQLIASKKSSNKLLIPSENIVQMVRGKLYPGSELISYSPSIITNQYALLKKKSVPVIYEGHINLAQGYILDGDITITPENVNIFSSNSVLDTTFFAYTISDTIHGLNANKNILIPLRPLRGVKYLPDSVRVSITVDEFNTKELDIPVTCINLPKELSAKFFPSTVKVSFSVGVKKYKDISEKDFSILLDYNDIKDVKDMTIPVRLSKHPDFVKNLTITPAEVEFILEKE